MGDAIKWGILGASIIAIIALILGMPFVIAIGIGSSQLGYWVSVIVNGAGEFLQSARGLVNVFLFPIARDMLTALLSYLLFGWAIRISVYLVVWIYHWLFK